MSPAQHFPQHMDKVRFSAPSLCPSPLTLPIISLPKPRASPRLQAGQTQKEQELASSCLIPSSTAHTEQSRAKPSQAQ